MNPYDSLQTNDAYSYNQGWATFWWNEGLKATLVVTEASRVRVRVSAEALSVPLTLLLFQKRCSRMNMQHVCTQKIFLCYVINICTISGQPGRYFVLGASLPDGSIMLQWAENHQMPLHTQQLVTLNHANNPSPAFSLKIRNFQDPRKTMSGKL